jgi:hypothetical protein
MTGAAITAEALRRAIADLIDGILMINKINFFLKKINIIKRYYYSIIISFYS